MSSESPWSDGRPIPGISVDSQEPVLTSTPDAIHVVWTSNKTLYHSCLTAGRWQEPTLFANGEQPALASGPDGSVHCIFSHWFLGNCEIYHVRWTNNAWSLPQLVSRTSGISSQPALSVAEDGGAHIVWADTTPGASTVYYARPQGNAWANAPIPNAAGSRPVIGLAPSGDIYVAWQDRLAETGRFQVLAAVGRDEVWGVPELVSDSPSQHAINPALAINPQGACHLIWQEERGSTYVIRHAERLAGGWSWPGDISTPSCDARLPRIAAAPKGFLQAMWVEDAALRHRAHPAESKAFWWGGEAACDPCPGVSALAIAISPTSAELHAVWSAYEASDQRRLYHAFRAPVIRHTVFIPIVSGPD